MTHTLSTNEAVKELHDDGYSSFSYQGAVALVEYLEELEEETGTPIQFCRVGLHCEFSEYESLTEWGEDYFGGRDMMMKGIGSDDTEDSDDIDQKLSDYIQYHGQLIEFKGGIIVNGF